MYFLLPVLGSHWRDVSSGITHIIYASDILLPTQLLHKTVVSEVSGILWLVMVLSGVNVHLNKEKPAQLLERGSHSGDSKYICAVICRIWELRKCELHSTFCEHELQHV